MTATQTQIRRGTSTQVAAMTPVDGEVVYNTTDDRLHAGNGSTAGGIPHANYVDVQKETFVFGTVGGTANAITLTHLPVVSSYANGLRLKFKATGTNSGATTVNVDGLGAKNIYKVSGTSLVALSGNEIVSGAIYEINYDGTQFQLGSGSSSLGVNVQVFTSSGTYTPTAGMKYCTVELQGGGGGGTSDTNNGVTGGNSAFGALLTANGGPGGNPSIGTGGTASGGDINISGQNGVPGALIAGSSYLGVGGIGTASSTTGDGTGYGAGGLGNQASGTKSNGAGGGYCRKTFSAATIGASQSVTVGAAGAKGSGTGGSPGRQGICIVTEFFT